MRTFLLIFFIFLAIYLNFFCKSSIVSKKELINWNNNLIENSFRTVQDLYLYEYNYENNNFIKISDKILVKKNVVVKIQIESTEDWLRLRVIDVSKNPKENLGDVIMYIIANEEKKLKFSDIQNIVENFIFMNFQKLN